MNYASLCMKKCRSPTIQHRKPGNCKQYPRFAFNLKQTVHIQGGAPHSRRFIYEKWYSILNLFTKGCVGSLGAHFKIIWKYTR